MSTLYINFMQQYIYEYLKEELAMRRELKRCRYSNVVVFPDTSHRYWINRFTGSSPVFHVIIVLA